MFVQPTHQRHFVCRFNLSVRKLFPSLFLFCFPISIRSAESVTFKLLRQTIPIAVKQTSVSVGIIYIPFKMLIIYIFLLNVAIIVYYPHFLCLLVYQKTGSVIILTTGDFDSILFITFIAVVIRMRPRPNAEFSYFRSPSVVSGDDNIFVGVIHAVDARR